MKPYYQDKFATIYHGDFRSVLPIVKDVDVIIADPPYGETSLEWDKWPEGWPGLMREVAHYDSSLWCWGSMRMFWEKRDEFERWRLVQDLIWEKQNGTGMHTDRFRRVHETVLQFRHEESVWEAMYHKTPVTMDALARSVKRKTKPAHWGKVSHGTYDVEDGGPRLVRSVIFEPNAHRNALHPTQKPEGLTSYLVEYSCPPEGLIFVPFMGSGTDLAAAKINGRRVIGCDKGEENCEKAANRLAQEYLSIAT
jgi:site-specific DNA-methyltransferase (adenine-specific)